MGGSSEHSARHFESLDGINERLVEARSKLVHQFDLNREHLVEALNVNLD